MIYYRDTRDLDKRRLRFSEVLLEGIAEGGGLYVPERIPVLPLDTILEIASLPYFERAAKLFRSFGVDVSDERLSALLEEAYGENFDHPQVAPTVKAQEGVHVLELWHGPTLAFKDMALQCMPRFFSEAISMRKASGDRGEEYLILVATSGDTGKAALEGFADREHIKIAVFYPAEGVSDIQRRQMVTQRGNNLSVFGVRGNFDDCQNAVKAAFKDADFVKALLEKKRLVLSSANSINWGRLLPQVVYYASAYSDMASSGWVRPGEPIDVCVPTGNFGNILGAWYARKMGVPIGRLICASNENHVLTDFIRTGTYDISQRPFIKTPSPSMDILVSSNLERLLYEICRSGEKIRGWMDDLMRNRCFRVDDDTLQAVQAEFTADFVPNDRSLETIREVYLDSGYLLDPHTAVAWEAGRRQRLESPLLVVSTAHWAKFGEDVYRALSQIPYTARLPEEIRGLSGPEMLERVIELSANQSIPKPLAELAFLKERFTSVTEGTREGVEDALCSWLSC